MDSWMVWVIALLLIALAGGLVKSLTGGKRQKTLEQLAFERGFSFHPDPSLAVNYLPVSDHGLNGPSYSDDPFPPSSHFPLFLEDGIGGIQDGVLQASVNGNDVTLFNYRVESYQLTVACFSLGQVGIPEFQLKGSFGPDARDLNSGGIIGKLKFDTNREFSKAYVLRAVDQEATRTLFDSNVLDFFSRNKGLTVEAGDGLSGKWLVVYRRAVGSEETPSFLDEATTVFKVFSRS